ncbi:MAG TPA: hypothetical protein VFE03_16290 [Caulobacteraceae bacterium]|jgi:hypothetical protein|nr:hypothetical protein [Caulobacteraceae bacterium]
MRLRQIALIAHDIPPIQDQLEKVFGIKVGFRDPGVEYFGLTNIVCPVGGEFLEVVSPFRDDASGARYLARRGGDAGYMVILQDADALSHRARLEKEGVRLIATSRHPGYQYTHFHPADCAGVLLSIDSVDDDAAWREPQSEWPPAGPEWRAHQSEESLGIVSATIQSKDPVAAAERFSMLLGRPVTRDGEVLELKLDPGVLRFTAPVDSDGTGVVALDIRVRDPGDVIAAARVAGVTTDGQSVTICGVRITPLA